MRRRLDIRYACLGTENALSAVPTSFPILIGKKIDHLDVQVYDRSELQGIHPFHTRSSRHSQTRLRTKQVLYIIQKNLS